MFYRTLLVSFYVALATTVATAQDITLSYNALHQLTTQTYSDGTSTSSEYQGGLLTKQTDELGRSTTFTHCKSCGAIESITGPMSEELWMTRDTDHQMTAFIEERGKKTEYKTNNQKQVTQIVHPDGVIDYLSYGRYGNVSSWSNGDYSLEYGWESPTRLSVINNSTWYSPDPERPNTYFSHTVAGGKSVVSSITDTNNTGVAYSYYRNGLVESITRFMGRGVFSGKSHTISYSYYPDNLVKKKEWKEGTTLIASWEYEYEGSGKVNKVTNHLGEVTTYSYDTRGRLTEEKSLTPRIRTLYQYESVKNRVTRITSERYSSTGGVESTLLNLSLTYDAVGNILSTTEGSTTYFYSYDPRDRLVSETRTGGIQKTWVYDAAGNLTHEGSTPVGGFNARNQQTWVAGQASTPTYDRSGNTKTLSFNGGKSFSFLWSAHGFLRGSTVGNTSITYQANPDTHSLMTKEVGDTGTWYLRDGEGQVIGEYEKTSQGYGVKAIYTQGALGLISEIKGGVSQWYVFGARGETRKVISQTGSTRNSYAYGAWGEIESQVEVTPSIFKYSGRYSCITDSDVDAVSCGVRWYVPRIKRWLSEDPKGFSGGVNLYQYVLNNPLKYVDVTGREPVKQLPPMYMRPPRPGQEGSDPIVIPPFFLPPRPLSEIPPCPLNVQGCQGNPSLWGPYPGNTCAFHGCGDCFNEITQFYPRNQCCYDKTTGKLYTGNLKGTPDYYKCENGFFECVLHTIDDSGGPFGNIPSEVKGLIKGD